MLCLHQSSKQLGRMVRSPSRTNSSCATSLAAPYCSPIWICTIRHGKQKMFSIQRRKRGVENNCQEAEKGNWRREAKSVGGWASAVSLIESSSAIPFSLGPPFFLIYIYIMRHHCMPFNLEEQYRRHCQFLCCLLCPRSALLRWLHSSRVSNFLPLVISYMEREQKAGGKVFQISRQDPHPGKRKIYNAQQCRQSAEKTSTKYSGGEPSI